MSLPNKLRAGEHRGAENRPILCYVTDRRSLRVPEQYDAVENLLRTIEAAALAGVDWIQIREKDLPTRECAAVAREALMRIARVASENGGGPRISVNDRADVAIAERAGGVHLGENSLPVVGIKKLWSFAADLQGCRGQPFSVGVSCHSLGAAKSARDGGADYLFFGPVFATPSKAAYGAPQGVDRLAEVCSAVTIPVLAIGGITLENAATCLAAGASGIAAIRLFQKATDLQRVVRALRNLGS